MNPSPESEFWDWFIANTADLNRAEDAREPIVQELARRLRLDHPDITYELGLGPREVREVIISAEGVKDLIPIVKRISGAAPPINGWKVISFRPRKEDFAESRLNYSGKKFDPAKMWFVGLTEDGHFDLILYLPRSLLRDRKLAMAASFILLDCALGEYDVMTKIRYVDFQPRPWNPTGKGLMKFSELPRVLDGWHKSKAVSEGQDAP